MYKQFCITLCYKIKGKRAEARVSRVGDKKGSEIRKKD